jgi:hypothetical protein
MKRSTSSGVAATTKLVKKTNFGSVPDGRTPADRTGWFSYREDTGRWCEFRFCERRMSLNTDSPRLTVSES